MARPTMAGGKKVLLGAADISRIVEMAWEDRTPFEAIEQQFGLNQDKVIRLMRLQLSRRSFMSWRARTRGQMTKHLHKRSARVSRHCGSQHLKMHRP